MRKFYVVMAVVITFLVVLNIQVTGVGATTQTASWYKHTGKSAMTTLQNDAHKIAVIARDDNSTKMDLVLACDTLEREASLMTYKKKIPNAAMQRQWINVIGKFKSAGTACLIGVANNDVDQVTLAAKDLKSGKDGIAKLTKQVK